MTYSFIVSQGVKTSPSVDVIGITNDKNSQAGPSVREGFTLHFVINGKGYFNDNLVKAGQGFLAFDGMYAEHHPDPDDPWELMWITISGDNAEEIFNSYVADPKTNIFNCDMYITVCETAKKIYSCKQAGIDSMKMLEMFLQLHCNCMKTNSSIKKNNTAQVYTDYATRYIKANMHRMVTVDELTKLTGISQPYLYRLFKNEFGISPKQYITQYKLNTAKTLLENTDMSISEIASSVGYEDALAFSKMFSLNEKISPMNYRKEYSEL